MFRNLGKRNCAQWGEHKPHPNNLYPLLRSLEEKGYINGNWDNPDTRGKRIYSITTLGIEIIPVVREKARQRLDELEKKIKVLRQVLFNE